jgi:hypothetical protein
MMDASTIELLRVTKEVGATVKPGPALFAGPGEVCTDDDLRGVGADADLNGPMVADLLTAMAAHENLGTNLYRMLARTSDSPALTTRFKRFEGDSIEAVGVFRTLFEALGIPWRYVSPSARLTEAMDAKLQEAFLLAGSADPATAELKRLDAVLIASTLCVANTALLAQLAAGLDDGPTRQALEEAVATLEGPQAEHLEWAADTRQSMALGQARNELAQTAAIATETVVGKVKDVARTITDAVR